jgi:diguanylate cyclase (GGDEF)-like protein
MRDVKYPLQMQLPLPTNCYGRLQGLVLLLLTGSVLYAQEYSFRMFGNGEGLENLSIRQIYQDRVGFLWVSTENGIYRFDGERFEGFGPSQGIPSTSVAKLGDAPDGSLLVGGDFGLYRFRDNRFVKVEGPFHTLNWSQGIESDHKGQTFIGTDAGLFEITKTPGRDEFTMRRIPPVPGTSGPEASAILVDGDVLWYGCGLELCRRDEKGTRVYGRESGLPDRTVMGIQKDNAGVVWVRSKNEGVFEMPAGGTRFSKPALGNFGPLPNGQPSLDADGRILLPSPDGLLIHDRDGWSKINRFGGLHGVIYSVFQDRQGALWIGMAGRGLVRWQGYRQWESYSTASGMASDIAYEILPQPGGALWVGTEGGLERGQHQSSGMQWKGIPGLVGFPVHAVRAAPNGDLWVGTETKGVARLAVRSGNVKWIGEAQGLVGKAAYTLRFDREHRLWVATERGLFLATEPYIRFTRVAELPAGRVWAIAEGSDGTMWAGGAGGLYSFTDGQWRNFSQKDGLTEQEVLSLGADSDGSVWVGYRYGGGIDRVRQQAGHLSVIKGVQRPGTNGLIYFLEFDAAKHLWVGTEHGVDVWDGARWTHYDSGDGLVWNDCNLNAFAQDLDGAIWIGTSGGLSRFMPRKSNAPDMPMHVVFTRLILGKEDVSGKTNPTIKFAANSLVAQYTAMNASRENGVLFRYRLGGANSAWTETARRELQFAELSPGNYRLRIEAQDRDGVWRGQAAEFSFRVLTPWYRSWWFLTLCGLVPLLIALAVVRSRMAELRRREVEFQRLMGAHEEIRNLAFFDPLTGLPNRRMLLDRLTNSMASSARNPRLHALLFIDLDNFKTLNDTQGHQTGDLLLREVARRLSDSVREADTVARFGGDEFVVMIDQLNQVPQVAATEAGSVAEKILTVVGQPYRLDGHDCMSGCSIGITIFGNSRESTDSILQQADIAMYQAKLAGRNTVRFFAPALQAAVNARAAMEHDLRNAIKAGQFVLQFQPQLNGGVIFGGEALLCWMHPQRGILAPGEFIPLAEETGLILPLGDWVLEGACRQIAAWEESRETAAITVSANISALQFRQPDFVDRVLMALDRTGASPQRLNLELTESMLVENLDEVIAKMTELKEHGLKFSLDDFGTGYASLSYLKRLPLDELKIDRSFVRDILTDASSGAIAQAVISLSGALGLSVIAEGVETEEQRAALADLGCHAFQGFLFSRPLPPEEFELLLRGEQLSQSQAALLGQERCEYDLQ